MTGRSRKNARKKIARKNELVAKINGSNMTRSKEDFAVKTAHFAFTNLATRPEKAIYIRRSLETEYG